MALAKYPIELCRLRRQVVLDVRSLHAATSVPAIAGQFQSVSGSFAIGAAIFAVFAPRAVTRTVGANVLSILSFHSDLQGRDS
jgi:hypothetical protein